MHSLTPEARVRETRPGAAAVEMAFVMPVCLLLILGCLDFGRFVYDLIAVTNAARAGAGVGIMSAYPDPDPSQGACLTNWQRAVCNAVANELGMATDFTPSGSGDGGYANSQGLLIQASRDGEADGRWQVQVSVKCPFTWWSFPSSAQPQQTAVYRAIR
jgi:Flp pilus assembly protein TadG